MTKLETVFAVLVAGACVAMAPASQAGTPACASGSANCHFVGAGSPTQYTTSALAADQIAFTNLTGSNTNGSCTFHYTGASAGNILDNRDPLGRIPSENGNLWVVWVAAQDGASCASSLGGTNVTDIWADISVCGWHPFLPGYRTGRGPGCPAPSRHRNRCRKPDLPCESMGGW
jgi:hypothetical protein